MTHAPNPTIEAPNYTMRRLVAGGIVMAGTLGVAGGLAACGGENPNDNNYCTVALESGNSINNVNRILSKADEDYDGKIKVVDPKTGDPLNIYRDDPNAVQPAGSIVVARGASMSACDKVAGQYYYDQAPKFPLPPAPSNVVE